jgi:hypothetical protein
MDIENSPGAPARQCAAAARHLWCLPGGELAADDGWICE